ncbi:MAG: response regulator [Candidatus Falkowbacteria bacterium]
MPKKILIAEDEASLSKALSLKLANLGFEVELAEDGAQALSLLKSKSFDLMLLDLMMPKLDGFGVLAEKKDWKSKPVVFVSSNLSQQSDKTKALEAGADQFLVKSDVSLKELVNKINEALS